MGMNASLVICDGNGGQLDLLKAPFQHVKPWLHQASCNTRSVLAASSRTDLKDMPLFDSLAYGTIMKRMPAERRDRIKLTHCCGGASPVKLHQLATHIEEKCPHCGHPKGDTIHLIWQCPAFAHIRFKNAPRLEQLIVEACPAYFLLGIPGAFPALPSDWFAVPLPPSESKIDGSFGLGLKSQPKFFFDCADFVQNSGDEIAGLNYLQAAAKLLQVPCIDSCPRMTHVEGSPPPTPNTWSDGSRTRPSLGNFSTMSFGLWTPGAQKISAECQLASIALPIDVPDGQVGHLCAGLLIGQQGSSTRAEIAGGIAALLQPFPVHIGTDSEAFLCKAKQILENPELQPRKPFMMQRDVDLWQIFTQLVVDRGANSIALSWKKAHASFHEILSRKVAGQDAVANGLADWAASKAHAAANQTMRENYLCYLDAKRADFIEVLCDINFMICDILEADATIRKEKASLPKQVLGVANPKMQPLLLATTYECPGTDLGARLDLWEPCGHQSAVGLDHNFDSLLLFWSTAYFVPVPAEEGQLGSSWIELFARFSALGGKLVPKDKTTGHQSFKKVHFFCAVLSRLVRYPGLQFNC